jgi:hypothetical protein
LKARRFEDLLSRLFLALAKDAAGDIDGAFGHTRSRTDRS